MTSWSIGKFTGLLILFLLIFGPLKPMSHRAVAQPLVHQKWTTAPVLKVPESVLYHPSDQMLYVSNINGKPLKKNGSGFISKLNLAGEIVTLKWAEGLNSPTGAVIHGDRFYVADIDALVAIDLNTGRIMERFPAANAVFLNDVAVDAQGKVYVSDFSAANSAIYRLDGGQLTIWLKDPELGKPNGLHMQKDRLLVGNCTDGCIKAVDLKTRIIQTIAKIGWGIDGLRSDGKGNFLISDWAGKTAFVTADGGVTVLLDTTDKKINAADLEYIPEKGLLLIPTFFDNRVVAYQTKMSTK